MRLSHQYRLRPTAQQQVQMEQWLELLRRQYNHRLAERFNWWEQNRCDVNACPLICHLPEPKDKPTYYVQATDLPNSKTLFPEYKQVYSQVLQDCVKRVEKTYDRWIKGDSNGNRSGKPRFKGKGRYRSFTFSQIKNQNCINGKFIKLPKIGNVKLILHRPLPDGFKIKTATITRKIDGWYLNLSLEDASVPIITPDAPTMDNTIGIDVGLKSFLVTSTGESVEIPQYYRKAEKRLKRLQRQLSKKKKGSKRRVKAIKRLAKAHLKVANQRKDFHYKTANHLLTQGHVAHEDLNIKGLAKSKLAKSVNDAGWGQFLQILSFKAAKAGLMTIPVNPNGTTQACSGCGETVPKTIADRWHSCPHCGLELDRDHNAAINIKQRAVGHPVQALGGDRVVEPEKREACAVS
ncbi:RNA-guided endonuclease InsQ/TnpB family protein [Pantanalinema sp. GBBB05]|uniref:RNA-guided endonuclease InsQ/TnpB family protein n=1 Tax=Pantanalinema sp. GBBB05 TaxID=2604139 RepID=UPI001D50F701|nr:transposase [Pantanalinema sp. GBBB05]